MKKTKFKNAMKRGLGRCLIELNSQKNIEVYRDIVLWGCLHNLAYDAQSEGTRAEYVYHLQSKFEDDYFEINVIEAYKEPIKDSWLFGHYTELLYWFALKGSSSARQALFEKFEYLLNRLSKFPSRKIIRPEREQFEWLCIWLTSLDGFFGFKWIVEKVGKSIIDNKRISEINLDWFVDNSILKFGEQRLGKYLNKYSDKSDSVKAFRNTFIKDFKSTEVDLRYIGIDITLNEFIESCRDGCFLNIMNANIYATKASSEELEKISELVIKENDLNIKARLLSVFRSASYPSDIKLVIEYANSSCESLQEIAIEILQNNPSEEVHKYAISLANEQSKAVDAIMLLCSNYSDADRDLLLRCLKSISVTDKTNWHTAYINVLSLCEKNKKAPDDLLIYMYEHTLCSYCRNDIVKCMGKRKILSEDILSECLFDSYEDTRKYASRKITHQNLITIGI